MRCASKVALSIRSECDYCGRWDGSDLSETTAVDACVWPSHLSLPAAPCRHHTTESSVVQRYHVDPAAGGLHLSGRRHGLVSRYVLSGEVSTILDSE